VEYWPLAAKTFKANHKKATMHEMSVVDYNLFLEMIFHGVFPEDAEKDHTRSVLYDEGEYVVSKILEERRNEEGETEYLLEWEST
jgi:hypothetical protein